MTDEQGDLNVFDMLVEQTDEGPEPGQPELPQEPTWTPADAQPAAG